MRFSLRVAIGAGLLVLGMQSGIAQTEEADEPLLDPGEAEFDEVEGARRAREAARGSWDQDRDEQIRVQERVLIPETVAVVPARRFPGRDAVR